jgi:hypothetical protein
MPRNPFLEVEKSQAVRLADVLLIGPVLLYLATRERELSALEKLALAGIGVGTILYNWRNWQANREAGR